MDDFEMIITSYIGKEKHMRLKQLRIGIAGAGGLGSNCAVHLVRSGFARFTIADYDRVESSNLNRQFYFLNQVGDYKTGALKKNLEAINPGVQIKCVNTRIDQKNACQVFNCCDAVVEAFDDPESKALLFEMLGTGDIFMVGASGVAGWGGLEDIKIKRLNERTVVIGDFISGVEKGIPPMSPKVNIIAAMMADTVLEYFLGGFLNEIDI